MALRIVFMGTPNFATYALHGLIQSTHAMVAVYSQPPRPAGRGYMLTPSPVHQLAQTHHIPVYTPANFKSAESIEQFKALHADIAVVAAYGLLLPKAILEAFPKGCINIHPSALPRWRGAAPIQRTVLAGDATTAICIMQMDEGLDTGAILAKKELAVPDRVTSGDLHDLLARESVPLLQDILTAIENGTAKSIPQTTQGITYAPKILKNETWIDWTQSAQAIERQIRGLSPSPSAVTSLAGETIKILAAETAPNPTMRLAGSLLSPSLTIACGKDALQIKRLQRPGKKAMDAEECLRGFFIPPDATCEPYKMGG